MKFFCLSCDRGLKILFTVEHSPKYLGIMTQKKNELEKLWLDFVKNLQLKGRLVSIELSKIITLFHENKTKLHLQHERET